MNHVSNHTNTPSEHSKQRGTAKAFVSTNPASSVQRPASSKAATRPAKTATRLSAAKNTATARHHKNTMHPTNPNKERPLYAPNTPLGFLFPRRLSGAGAADDRPSPSRWDLEKPSENETDSSPAGLADTQATRGGLGGCAMTLSSSVTVTVNKSGAYSTNTFHGMS